MAYSALSAARWNVFNKTPLLVREPTGQAWAGRRTDEKCSILLQPTFYTLSQLLLFSFSLFTRSGSLRTTRSCGRWHIMLTLLHNSHMARVWIYDSCTCQLASSDLGLITKNSNDACIHGKWSAFLESRCFTLHVGIQPFVPTLVAPTTLRSATCSSAVTATAQRRKTIGVQYFAQGHCDTLTAGGQRSNQRPSNDRVK